MSESLAFKYFPWQYWRPSGVNAEFDPSQANTATQNARALLIGQITSSGTATPNIAVQVYSQTQVNGLCGLNSMLALKYAAYRLMDPFGEVWLGPLTDASGGTAATGKIGFTGAATVALTARPRAPHPTNRFTQSSTASPLLISVCTRPSIMKVGETWMPFWRA